MALNKRRLSRSQKKAKSGGGGGFFKFEEGRNTIRIFAFGHTVVKGDFKRGLYQKGEGEVGDEFDEVDREVYRHFTEDGVVNCLIKDCKYCDESDDLLSSNKKADKKLGNSLSASRAYYVNLVDVNDVDSGMQIGSLPSSVYSVVSGYINDPEFGEDVLGCCGRDFIVDRDKSEDPGRMYTTKLRDEKRCEELDESLSDDITDLFNCDALEPGWSSNDELNESKGSGETDKEKIDRKKSENKKSTNKKKKDNDFKDDEDEDKGKKSSSRMRSNKKEELPWEGDKNTFDTGDAVQFDEDGGKMTGKIVEINDSIAGVEIKGGDIYDIPLDELEHVTVRSGRKR